MVTQPFDLRLGVHTLLEWRASPVADGSLPDVHLHRPDQHAFEFVALVDHDQLPAFRDLRVRVAAVDLPQQVRGVRDPERRGVIAGESDLVGAVVAVRAVHAAGAGAVLGRQLIKQDRRVVGAALHHGTVEVLRDLVLQGPRGAHVRAFAAQHDTHHLPDERLAGPDRRVELHNLHAAPVRVDDLQHGIELVGPEFGHPVGQARPVRVVRVVRDGVDVD